MLLYIAQCDKYTRNTQVLLILEGVNRTRRVRQHSRRVNLRPAAADSTDSSCINQHGDVHLTEDEGRTRSCLIFTSLIDHRAPHQSINSNNFKGTSKHDDHQKSVKTQRSNPIADDAGRTRTGEKHEGVTGERWTRPSSTWRRLRTRFYYSCGCHEPFIVKSLFHTFQINVSTIRVKVTFRLNSNLHEGGGATVTPKQDGCQAAGQLLRPK